MSGLVEEVKRKVFGERCLTERIKRGRCNIDLTGAPQPRLIIDFDDEGSPLGENDPRPDFLFVSDTGGCASRGGRHYDPGRISPIEISQGRRAKEVEDLQKQLQAGACWVHKIAIQKLVPTLIPVYCGPLDKRVRDKIRKGDGKISFRGQSVSPKIIPCGGKLPNTV